VPGWPAHSAGKFAAMKAAASPPNVVIVLADDMGWGDLGCYGSTAIPTPNVDELARTGLRLTDCHAAAAVCTPSRYALLTGRYAWRSPLKRSVLMGHGPALIEPSRPTLASMLHDAGYATGAFGKWHLGLGWRRQDGTVVDVADPGLDLNSDPAADIDYRSPFADGPTVLGFERYFGMSASLDMPPYTFLDQDHTLGVPDRPKQPQYGEQRPGLQSPGWPDHEVDVRFVEAATQWIRDVAPHRPFFAYVPLSAPHRPCLPPDFARGRTTAGARGDMVWLLDWAVGQLRTALHDAGVFDDTLLIVSSDHGGLTHFTDDNGDGSHRPNGPWRGQKGDLWEGGHRIPFVAHWPRRIPAGLTRGDPVCLTDVLPTVAAAAGLTPPDGAGEDGRNVLSMLEDRGDVDPQRPIVHHSMGGRFAIRRGRWKAIFARGAAGGMSEPTAHQLFADHGVVPHPSPPWDAEHPQGQLYDMANDPGETVNLWDDKPDLVADLYEQLKAMCGDESSGLPFDVPLG
jgi:arylsulfatase A